MKIANTAVGICGLFCGTYRAFPQECGGCLSDRVIGPCIECRHGFRKCAKEHDVTWCWECVNFPCKLLDKFSREHIVNGICHHEHVIEDLQFMKKYSVEKWIEQQVKLHSCPNCGSLIVWYDKECHNCANSKK